MLVEQVDYKKVDLHRHAEGSLFVRWIFQIAEEFRVPFEEKTKREIESIIKQGLGHKSLENFIKLLSTRWMRLLIGKICLKNSNTLEGANLEVKACVERFYDFILSHAVETEGLTHINLLFSPFNLISEGDFTSEYFENRLNLHTDEILDEELRVYEQLVPLLKSKSNIGINLEEYCEIVHQKTIEYKKHGLHTFRTVAFRRDADFTRIVNGTKGLMTLVNRLHKLFTTGVIDFIDICGNESYRTFSLDNYSEFIKMLSIMGIPYTVHIAEVKYRDRGVAHQNLDTLLYKTEHDYNRFTPPLAAHAVRITDRLAQNHYFKAFTDKGIAVALNARSNIFTGLFSDVTEHRFIRNLFDLSQKEYLKSLLLTVCTDDPTIFSLLPSMTLENEYDCIFDALEKLRKKGVSIISGQEFLDAMAIKTPLTLAHLEMTLAYQRRMEADRKDATIGNLHPVGKSIHVRTTP